jgi:hypothetical protein
MGPDAETTIWALYFAHKSGLRKLADRDYAVARANFYEAVDAYVAWLKGLCEENQKVVKYTLERFGRLPLETELVKNAKCCDKPFVLPAPRYVVKTVKINYPWWSGQWLESYEVIVDTKTGKEVLIEVKTVRVYGGPGNHTDVVIVTPAVM